MFELQMRCQSSGEGGVCVCLCSSLFLQYDCVQFIHCASLNIESLIQDLFCAHEVASKLVTVATQFNPLLLLL